MKLITTVLAPEKLDAVAAALADVEVFRMTVTECRGISRDGETPTLVDKAKLEIAVNENFVQPTLEALQSAGSLEEESGFGKIFVTELLDVVRIRTGERGPDAI